MESDETYTFRAKGQRPEVRRMKTCFKHVFTNPVFLLFSLKKETKPDSGLIFLSSPQGAEKKNAPE